MPRRQKSKPRTRNRNREKHHQAQDDSQGHTGAQASEAVEKEPPSSSSPVVGDIPQNLSAIWSSSTPQGPYNVPSLITTYVDVLDTRSVESGYSQDREHPNSSEVPPDESSRNDSLAVKVGLLEQFLLYKYKMKQPITEEDMLKTVGPKYQDRFAEILKRASFRIEVSFAVDVKEVDTTIHLYDLVSKLKLPNNGRICAGRGLPKTGLLMTLLGVIIMKGNCATEEDIWNFLKMMRVYPGRKHFIYREPRKLITQDFVRLKYLEYRQVPYSDPPCYEFLWGPRAYTETSKMEVLEFLAKVSDTDPSVFSKRYEEALREKEERAKSKTAVSPGTTAMARPVPWPYPAFSPSPNKA